MTAFMTCRMGLVQQFNVGLVVTVGVVGDDVGDDSNRLSVGGMITSWRLFEHAVVERLLEVNYVGAGVVSLSTDAEYGRLPRAVFVVFAVDSDQEVEAVTSVRLLEICRLAGGVPVRVDGVCE